MRTKSIFLFIIFIGMLFGCAKKEDVAPDMVGNWQTKSINLEVQYKQGAPLRINGTSVIQTIQFKNDGTVNADNFLYGILFLLYGKYSINGDELTLESTSGELAYFTVSVSGSTMTWKMNREQGLRATQNSKDKTSLLDATPTDFDKIQSLDMIIEFSKK